METVKKENFFARLWAGIKYKLRKAVISIYHNPYQVVLVMSVITMGYFTFNYHLVAAQLSTTFNATITHCAYMIFVWTLFAYMSVISYLFYSGKKKNWIMFAVFEVMMVVQIAISIYFNSICTEAYITIMNSSNPLEYEDAIKAINVLSIYQVSTILCIVTVISSIVVIFLDKVFIKQRKARYEAKKAAIAASK